MSIAVVGCGKLDPRTRLTFMPQAGDHEYPPHLRAANEAKRTRTSMQGGVEGKQCQTCKEWMPLTEYGRDSARIDGVSNRCKPCTRQRGLKYYRDHAVAQRARRKQPEVRERINDYQSQWRKDRRQTDPNYRIRTKLRLDLWKLVTGTRRSQPMLDLLGCTRADLLAHLEAQFLDGMTWDNYGRGGWEIDHIRPCVEFDLTDPAQQRECFTLPNLRPIWASDNATKGPR